MATSAASIAVVPGGGENVNCVLFRARTDRRPAILTLDPKTVAAADRVILMGVGAAVPGMEKLEANGLVECLRMLQQPVLGICVGMQLLFERSAEGDVPCLGMLPGRVEALPNGAGLPVPHMGWNSLELLKADHPLLEGIRTGDWAFYAKQLLRTAIRRHRRQHRLWRADLRRGPARQCLWLPVPSGEVAPHGRRCSRTS